VHHAKWAALGEGDALDDLLRTGHSQEVHEMPVALDFGIVQDSESRD
jgi:hypothetical protein